MQPENQAPPAPPPMTAPTSSGRQDPYAFFMQPPQKQKNTRLPGSSSLKGRILTVLAGITILLIVGGIASSLLLNGGKGAAQGYIDISREQQEIIRIATVGSNKARSSDTQYLANTARLTVTTDQKLLIANIQKSGVKVNPKQLGTKKDAKADARLSQAEQSNNFDAVFTEILQSKLVVYQKSLKKAYLKSSGKTKKLFTNEYDNTVKIIGPAPSKSSQ